MHHMGACRKLKFILGVFTLAICLMVLETPIREKHGSFNNIWYKFIPRKNDIYEPIGTTIEVSGEGEPMIQAMF